MRVEHIGNATLYLGDAAAVIPTLPSIDCVVTSPPYNQLGTLPTKGSGLWGKSTGGAGFLRAWAGASYSDSMSEPDYQQWQNAVFSALYGLCSERASLFYNHQVRWRDGECLHPVQWFTPEGWRLRQEIIWNRAGGMMFNARMFCRFDERILWFVRGDKWTWNQELVGHGTIWNIAREQQQQGDKEHPVAYPIELPSRCIAATTIPCDVVLDPFMGSASTGVAALQLGRAFIGCEIDPAYFDIACRRIEQAQKQGALFKHEEPKAEQLTL
jgi:site-specific DNA-methyltransferase (adenine-specific)